MPETKSNDAAPQLRIRKYPNRRYYDTTRSRHLTLDQIHSAVRDGSEIEVTDSRSGTDITVRVLAQIIIDLDPPKLDVFPVALLHRLLRANQQLVQDFTQKYFNAALTAFLESQRKFEQSVRQTLGLESSATATVADWTRFMTGGASSGDGAAPTASAVEPDLQPVVDDLRRQIKDLEKRLSDAKPAAKTSKAKSKSPAS